MSLKYSISAVTGRTYILKTKQSEKLITKVSEQLLCK